MRTKYRLPGAITPPPGKKSAPMRMFYSPHVRNVIFFTIERDVLVFDIEVYQVHSGPPPPRMLITFQLLSSVTTSERAKSPIIQLLVSRENDRFTTLHEDGTYEYKGKGSHRRDSHISK